MDGQPCNAAQAAIGAALTGFLRQLQNRRDPSRRVGEVLDFLGLEEAAKDVMFSMGEPFFLDPIPAELCRLTVGRTSSQKALPLR